MLTITHIFFDLHGVLVDSQRMLQNQRRGIGQIMAERYGQSPEIWEEAYQRIVADWDSYFADLNLSGDEMLRDLKEGWFRVTRALFRLVAVAEPEKNEISQLSLELLATAPAYGDALYADARIAVERLHEKGYHLGVVTHALAGQAQAALRGANILDYFSAPIIGCDTVEQFDKDQMFFIKMANLAQVQPEKCLVVEDSDIAISSAKSAGMQTIKIARNAEEESKHYITNLMQLLV